MLSKVPRPLARAINARLRTRQEVLRDQKLIRMLEIGTKHCKPRAIEVIFEIGANHGQDAELLREYYDVRPEHVFVFEPHPELAAEISRRFPAFNLFRCALSDRAGRGTFNIAPVGSRNDGVSTLGERVLVKGDEAFRQVEVDIDTLDHVMEQLPYVSMIDLLKIDVEGFSLEVIDGAAHTLSERVAVLQLECEVVEVFKGQKLYPEVADRLRKLGFLETYKEQHVTQNDTVWVHERFWRKPEEFYTSGVPARQDDRGPTPPTGAARRG